MDPAGAISGGIVVALRDCGINVPDDETLKSFIGSPLAVSLEALPGVTEPSGPYLEFGQFSTGVRALARLATD